MRESDSHLTGFDVLQFWSDWYVASALEPPAGGAGAGARGAPHNPWQREEREREADVRRLQARARR